jgi:hypothetical protein
LEDGESFVCVGLDGGGFGELEGEECGALHLKVVYFTNAIKPAATAQGMLTHKGAMNERSQATTTVGVRNSRNSAISIIAQPKLLLGSLIVLISQERKEVSR